MPSDIERCRFFLKDTIRMMTDFSATGQSRGLPAPPLQTDAMKLAEQLRQI